MRKMLSRVAFGAAVAATLGFGTTQALAAPQPDAGKVEAACTDRYCRNVACYPFYGYCDEFRGWCVCAG